MKMPNVFKKKARGITLFLALVFICVAGTSCGSEKSPARRYDYDLSEYVKIGPYLGIEAPFADPDSCTEEEIDTAVFQVMLTYADFSEEKDVVEKYDQAIVDFSLVQNGVTMEDYSQSDYPLIVGLYLGRDLDEALADALIGARQGEVRSVDYTFPDDVQSLGSWAGQTVTVQGLVKRILRANVQECTDAFVQSLDGYAFQTVQEFRDAVREDLKTNKSQQKRAMVLQAFSDSVEVIRYPEKEIDDYIAQDRAQLEELAKEENMTYEEYLSSIGSDDEEVASAALKEAQERVKADMASIQVCRLMQTTLNDEEYNTALQALFETEKGNFSDCAEMEAYYTPAVLRDSFLWQKSFEVMVDNAVSTLS